MIEKIEIAVLDRLNQAFGNTKPALGYKIEKIDSYKAELSDFGTLIKNRRTAALVACGGLSLEADYPEGSDYSFSLLIYLYSRNAKLNECSTRFGGRGSVGLYRMITDVVRLLNRNDLGFLSEPLKLGEARPIVSSHFCLLIIFSAKGQKILSVKVVRILVSSLLQSLAGYFPDKYKLTLERA